MALRNCNLSSMALYLSECTAGFRLTMCVCSNNGVAINKHAMHYTYRTRGLYHEEIYTFIIFVFIFLFLFKYMFGLTWPIHAHHYHHVEPHISRLNYQKNTKSSTQHYLYNILRFINKFQEQTA